MKEFRNKPALEKGLETVAVDLRSGAGELARRAIRLFDLAEPKRGVTLKRYVRAVRDLAVRIAHSRPAMAPIRGAIALLWHDFEKQGGASTSPEEAFAILKAIRRNVSNQLKNTRQRTAEHYRETFVEIKRPMIISYSSQVITALTPPRGRGPRVTVCESRPRFEGRRTARKLSPTCRSVTLITEAEIARAMGDCDAAVLGCDAINADGSVVNKTGSFVMAMAAKSCGVPVIVLGDRFKLAGREFAPHEPHDSGEVWTSPPTKVEVVNLYFETIPREFIDFVVLESGVHHAKSVPSLWRAWQKWI